MRIVIAATLAVVAGLVAANMLGVASAEAPTATTAPVRSLSVEGVANVPVAQSANLATATAVYRQAMAEAMTDGQSKAEFLAGKAAVTLGTVQRIVEAGGYINCTNNEDTSYAEYEGEQPDFGSPSSSIAVAPAAESESTPSSGAVRKPTLKHPKKRVSAHKASAAKCTLTASVALVYAIS
jgi:Protein of unknown function (DUF541)